MLIHGHFDISGPPDVPWVLHRAWPGSELHLVRTGHQGGDEMTKPMMTALAVGAPGIRRPDGLRDVY